MIKQSGQASYATTLARKADEIDRYVGQQIRNRRLELGLSQQALAQHLNVTYQQIQKYECAQNRIAPGKLFALTEFYDVEIGYFFPPRDWLSATRTQNSMSELDRAKRQEAHSLLDEILNLQQYQRPQ